MNMKKIFAILMALCMIFGLVACGGGTSDPIQPDEVIVDTSTNDTVETPATDPVVNDPTIDQVLYDADGITIVCKGFVPGSEDGWDDPKVKFLITNDTDKNITVQVRDVSVNGFMIDPTCSEDVAAGKKMNGDMSWLQMYFDENGITEVETIEFYFHIYESDGDWDTIADSDIITLNFN
jgi:predicted small lipoprotein YifL